MSVSVIPFQLVNLLSDLYPTVEDSRRVVDFARMDRTRIDFGLKAINNWHIILEEADRQNAVIAILDIIANEYDKRYTIEIARLKLLYLIHRSKLSLADIGRFCRECCPRDFVTQIKIVAPEDVFDKLFNIADRDDRRLSIFRFTERLALHLDVNDLQLAEQFRHWGDWLAKSADRHLNITSTDLQNLRKRLLYEQDNSSSKESYLLVELEPDRKTRRNGFYERFLVNIYLWKHEDNIDNWHHSQNFSYELAEIPKLIYKALNAHEDERPTAIEFFLPYELLFEPVDRWEIETETNIREKLRFKYRIAIRSWERSRDPQINLWRQAWREQWRLWKELQEFQTFWCCSPDEFAPQQLYDHLAVIREYALCLGFTFPPTTLLKIILQAGIPVIVWSRKQWANEDGIRQELETILSSANLPNLPAVIYAQRACREALDDPAHIGNHLVLFWDEHTRQLPKL